MKAIFYLIIFFATVSLIGCKGEVSNDVEDSSAIDRTFEYFANRSAEADAEEREIIDLHNKIMENNYPEFKTVADWFKTNPKELFGLEGNYYKIIKGTHQVGKSSTIVPLTKISDNGTYMYFFETEKQFFILELQVFDFSVNCINVRRILDGYGEEPMHDIIYNEKKVMIKEIHQGEVNPSLYESDGNLFFKYSKKINKKKYTNTLDLGQVLDI